MSDEVVVNVDSLVAAAAAGLEGGNGAGGCGGVGSGAAAPPMPAPEGIFPEIKILIERPGVSSSGTKDCVVQCKICHDEGMESEMEAPCGCDGTIKFAHRKCVQKWCDLKGDIICEICHQEYRPDYSVPPESEANRRSSLESRFNNAHFLALAAAAAENDLLPSNSEDEETNRSINFCKSAGSIVMMLLFIRHLLMIVVDTGLVQESSSAYFQVYVEFAGFLLPGYVLLRSLCLVQWRRLCQVLY